MHGENSAQQLVAEEGIDTLTIAPTDRYRNYPLGKILTQGPASIGITTKVAQANSLVMMKAGGALDAAQVRHALIGGFAMALRGVQRATVDLDFILMLEDLDRADRILTGAGYRRVFHGDNVPHYTAEQATLGRTDLLHAFRGPSLSMLVRAERIEIADGLTLPVVQTEDIVNACEAGMARLTADDRAAFRRLTEAGWVQSPAERSPELVAPTTETRYRYCLWATEASKWFKGTKPVRFCGINWKL